MLIVAVPATTPKSDIASKYEVGDAHSELDKLKGVLQKLQAENISLKAQLENMTDEEKDIQRELGATVTEIGKLSSELTIQRQHVLAAKNRLLEASAELKSHQEQKGCVLVRGMVGFFRPDLVDAWCVVLLSRSSHILFYIAAF